MAKAYRAYAFDLYGTLVDIRTDEEASSLWKKTALLLGFFGLSIAPGDLKMAYRRLCRERTEKMEKALARKKIPGPCEIDIVQVWQTLFRENGLPLSRTQAMEICRFFRAQSIRRLRLFPEVMTLLQSLRARKKEIYLLTNAQASFTRPELTLLGLDRAFDRIYISSEYGVKKPSSAFFGLLQQNGVSPGECLMVGNDQLCDCEGASSAGMDSLYIFTPQSPPPPAILPDRCRQIGCLLEVLDA